MSIESWPFGRSQKGRPAGNLPVGPTLCVLEWKDTKDKTSGKSDTYGVNGRRKSLKQGNRDGEETRHSEVCILMLCFVSRHRVREVGDKPSTAPITS